MTETCDRCGARSAVPGSFTRQRRSFRTSFGTWCPTCARRHGLAVLGWLYLVQIGMALIGGLLRILLPQDPIGWVLLNLCLVTFFLLLVIVPHELGHAFVARLVGFRVLRVIVGEGDILVWGRVLGFDMELRKIPVGGLTFAVPTQVRLYRAKRLAFILAGPLVNLLFAAVAWTLAPRHGLDSLRWPELGPQPAWAFFYANLFGLVTNLWPHDVVTAFGTFTSDGKSLWRSLQMDKDAAGRAHAMRFVMEAYYAHWKMEHVRARQWVEDGLRLYPGDANLLGWKSVIQIEQGEYQDSREQFLALLRQEASPSPSRSIYLNNIAYLDALIGEDGLLEEADRYSREALAALPSMPAVRGTRGMVLLAMGRTEEALPLFVEAMKGAQSRGHWAANAYAFAIAEARLGRMDAARDCLEQAVREDPTSHLRQRAEKALS